MNNKLNKFLVYNKNAYKIKKIEILFIHIVNSIISLIKTVLNIQT
jgi:hypothetical protein